MRIEKAAAAHAAAIAELEARCFAADPWPAETILYKLNEFFVALEGGELLGYLCLSHVLDEGSIDNVAVAPEQRRRGIAEALLAAAEAEAKSLALAFITLEVRAGNGPAIALYEKHGFARVGLRRGYYEKPKEDAILMTRFY